MDSLKTRLMDDMKSAMKNKDAERLLVIRSILAAIKQKEIDDRQEGVERAPLTDQEIWAVLEKMKKQREDSFNVFTEAGRQELADKEKFQLSVLAAYLPAAMDEAELRSIIQQAIEEEGATSIKELGRVMTRVKPMLQGRANMAVVSPLVKALLGGA